MARKGERTIRELLAEVEKRMREQSNSADVYAQYVLIQATLHWVLYGDAASPLGLVDFGAGKVFKNRRPHAR